MFITKVKQLGLLLEVRVSLNTPLAAEWLLGLKG